MAKALPARQTINESALTSGRRLRLTRQFNRHILPRLVLIPLAALFLLPLVWMVSMALKPTLELSAYPPKFLPQNPRWSNFSDATDVFPFWRYFWNTTVITFLTVLGSAISNPIVAYGFSRIEWPGRDKLFGLVLATVFIPFPVLIVGLFDIYNTLGWINTYLPLIVPLWFGNAFWIFLMRQFFMQIPKDISDAAKMDGANELRILFQIILPQAYPAVAVICIFAALHAWNDYFGPLIFLTNERTYTLSIGLTFFQSQSQYDVQYNLLLAASVLVVLPVLAIFFMFQRFFVEGVTVGSFK
jgi:multiple sugar transport system permease protein